MKLEDPLMCRLYLITSYLWLGLGLGLSQTFVATNDLPLSSSFDRLSDLFSSVSDFAYGMNCFNLSNDML